MSIKDKISKLIAKAESTNSDHEAEALAAKARELMIAHGLSLLDIGRLDAEDPVGTDHQAYAWFASHGWKKSLAITVAQYFGCRAIYTRVTKSRFNMHVVGRESARTTFKLMMPFINKEVIRRARDQVKLGTYPTQSRAERAIGNALTFRILRLIGERQIKQESQQAHALIPVDIIDLEVRDQFPSLREGRNTTLSTDAEAKKIASNIPLDYQVGENRETRQIGRDR